MACWSGVGAVDADAAELALPCCFRGGAGGGEVPVLLLGAKILERVVRADGGDAATDVNRLAGWRSKMHGGLQDFALAGRAVDGLAIGVELRLGKGDGELHGEVDLPAGRPGVDGAAAGDEALSRDRW